MDVFVTGTDTGVGKTVVSSVLVKILTETGKKTAYYKPIQTGAVIDNNEKSSEDVLEVTRLTGLHYNSGKYSSYLLDAPMSPFQAAKKENIKISIDTIMEDFQHIKKNNEHVVIEGAGGLYVPITDEALMIDMIEIMNVPVVVVVRPELGTINHSLLTIKALQKRNITILGFIVNFYPSKDKETEIIRDNPRMINKYSGIKCLGKVRESVLPVLDYEINKDFIL
ncbi:MAG: dethiobiotin synthase [Candidatus Margulisbacteria bacterium GWF2_35_9]|nr:MAG: dethiobiotin synthase [Candidatus Margulisbacteria bacterium GWF2_35_9]